ncbi:MAG: hypothetical protein JRG92_21660 [Deltaproteobacteria bacterium]|nr:hypothetical protein [Deltaproteobacteria bacterium]MBW2697556.1 hypothetical protein [Deltaproteobacteria bacterium]
MLDRILPERIDNHYRGHRLALWLFYPITLMTVGRSLVHIFRSDGGAQSIATIPLDSFVSGGADTVISVFALWGLSQLLIGLLFVLVLVRYRAMLPLMYVLILAEYLGRIGIGLTKPIVTVGTPPGGPGGLVLIVLAMLGLILSLRGEADLAQQESEPA